LLGQLMLSLYRAGRPAEALAAYQAFRRRFAEELGLEPSSEPRALERRILEHDPALGAPVAAPTVAPPRRITRGWVLAGAVVLAAVVASAVVGIELGTGGSGAVTTGLSRTGIVELAGKTGVASGAALAAAPAAMADGAGSIWLAVPDAGNVVRIDDATRQVTDTIPVGGSPSALAVGGGSVWAAGVPGDTIDRAALVRLYGGPAGATPTCQILPPGVFGHRRYCPYTRQPGADGRWQAPDLARARQLVVRWAARPGAAASATWMQRRSARLPARACWRVTQG
jgi:YVTN family beta-propeller protein